MATIYRKSYRRALPDEAEVRQRRGKLVARWTDGYGRRRTADMADDGESTIVESPV